MMIASIRRAGAFVAHAAVVLVLAAGITGCLSLLAQTPKQRLFAATSEYTIAVAAAADYCGRPDANVARCDQLGVLFHQSDALIQIIDSGLQAGTLGNNQVADLLRVLAALLDQMHASTPPPVADVPAPTPVEVMP